MRRFGTADEVSGVIAFLASPAGGYVTGTTVVIDGGADAWGTGHPAPQLEVRTNYRTSPSPKSSL